MYKNIFSKAVDLVKAGQKFTALVVWGTTNQSSWRADQGSTLLLFDNSGNGNANFNQVSGTSIVPQAEWGDGNTPREGDNPVVVEPVEPDTNGRFFFDDFETNAGNWANRDGNGEVTAVKATPANSYDGTGALSVSGRTSTWMGTSHGLNAREFVPGGTYKFGGAVMSPTTDTNFQLSVYYSLGGEDNYVTIATGSAAAGEWCDLEGTVEIPTGATGMMVYFETEYFETDGDGNLTDFYVDNAYGGTPNAVSPLKGGTSEPTTTTTTEPTTTTTEPTTTTTEPTTTTTEPTTTTTEPPTTTTEPTTTTTEPTTTTTEPTTTTTEPTTTTTDATTTTADDTTPTVATTPPTTTGDDTTPTTSTTLVTPSTTAEVTDNVVYGDVNNDNNINISDLVALCKHVVGIVGAELSGQGLANSDCDGDGIVNSDADDAMALAQFLVKKIVTLPYAA
jgi:hypothetical protein